MSTHLELNISSSRTALVAIGLIGRLVVGEALKKLIRSRDLA